MDNAVSIVQAYLRLNGYFTVTEFPIVEAQRGRANRTATDIDVMGFRFPHTGRLVPRSKGSGGSDHLIRVHDPALGSSPEMADMIIGEVKEGKAHINPGGRTPGVLRSALTRFGCCTHEEIEGGVERLIRAGNAQTEHGHQIRLVAFGSVAEDHTSYHTIELGHIFRFLHEHLRQHWDVYRVTELKDPALSSIASMIKSGIKLS